MRIGYISKNDPEDISAWSGIHFHMLKALEARGLEVELFGPLRKWHEYSAKVGNYILKKITSKKVSTQHTLFSSRRYASELNRLIRKAPPVDIYFASNASTEVASLDLDKPLVYLSDTTTQNMINYYPNYSDLLNWSLRHADTIEQKAISNANQLIFPSEWAAQSAINDYGAEPGSVHVVPYGANIPDISEPNSKKESTTAFHFLFIGKRWNRKGGPIALSALKKLKDEGIKLKFTVVGCSLNTKELPEFVDNIPFLDKNSPDELRKMYEFYTDADFLFMPVRNECFGVVFSEASAFGLPVISTRTGGVPTVVEHNETGFLLAIDASADEYASVTKTLIRDRKKYDNMCRASRERYKNTLNWGSWSNSVVEIFKSTIENE